MKRFVLSGTLSFLLLAGCTSSPATTLSIDASVRFDGAQFTITNNNDFDWYDAKATLDDTYTCSISMPIKAGQSYLFSYVQFVAANKTFEPKNGAPGGIVIQAKDKAGNVGFYSGYWSFR